MCTNIQIIQLNLLCLKQEGFYLTIGVRHQHFLQIYHFISFIIRREYHCQVLGFKIVKCLIDSPVLLREIYICILRVSSRNSGIFYILCIICILRVTSKHSGIFYILCICCTLLKYSKIFSFLTVSRVVNSVVLINFR